MFRRRGRDVPRTDWVRAVGFVDNSAAQVVASRGVHRRRDAARVAIPAGAHKPRGFVPALLPRFGQGRVRGERGARCDLSARRVGRGAHDAHDARGRLCYERAVECDFGRLLFRRSAPDMGLFRRVRPLLVHTAVLRRNQVPGEENTRARQARRRRRRRVRRVVRKRGRRDHGVDHHRAGVQWRQRGVRRRPHRLRRRRRASAGSRALETRADGVRDVDNLGGDDARLRAAHAVAQVRGVGRYRGAACLRRGRRAHRVLHVPSQVGGAVPLADPGVRCDERGGEFGGSGGRRETRFQPEILARRRGDCHRNRRNCGVRGVAVANRRHVRGVESRGGVAFRGPRRRRGDRGLLGFAGQGGGPGRAADVGEGRGVPLRRRG
mmetsp:Transcript_2998/g.10501  ORF Transcript_2998/g.10501 Transcript_2998/m.10501 type:complete len:379 (+) Transcript_2998:720-1856(+)